MVLIILGMEHTLEILRMERNMEVGLFIIITEIDLWANLEMGKKTVKVFLPILVVKQVLEIGKMIYISGIKKI